MNEHNIRFLKRSEDPFYLELQAAVEASIAQQARAAKGNVRGLLRACLVLAVLTVCYAHVLFVPAPVYVKIAEAFVLGLCIAATGLNVAHDALHSTLYPNRHINRIFGYSMDIVGSSSYLWKINHGAHHAFTNVHGKDGDIKESPILRLCPQAPHKPLHRYQHITAIPVYASFYLLVVYVFNVINILGYNFGKGDFRLKHPAGKVMEFILLKLLYLVLWVFIPLFVADIPFGVWLAGYLIASVTAGIALTLLFFVAHDVETTRFEDYADDKELSWATHQLHTTVNFRAHPIISYFVGGLNYQIEHHLFPGVSSVYYKDLSPIVSSIARKYGVPYQVNKSFGQAILSHFRLLKQLSASP